jgi:hypothetical protein
MSDLFNLHCSPNPNPRTAAANGPVPLSNERVMLMREPKIGQSLVIVGEGAGLVYTSPVRGFLQTARGWVVETANHLYTLTPVGVGNPTVADAA